MTGASPSPRPDAGFDILLVYAFSRVHAYYLNVVRALSPRLRVGIHLGSGELRSNASHRLTKLASTECLFLGELEEAGAVLVDGPCRAKVVALPNSGLSADHLRSVAAMVQGRRFIGLECFGYGPQMLDVLLEAGVSRFYVFDRNIFAAKLATQAARELAARVEVVEMGSPCVAHPAFPMPAMDYIVALPTQMLLGGWQNQRRFLRNMASLLKAIAPEDSVVLKFHNVRDGGNRYFHQYSGLPGLSRAGAYFAWSAARLLKHVLGDAALPAKFGVLGNDLYFSGLTQQLPLLASLTPRHNLNLELFFPHVRKGVITGISSCVWHALHAGLAVYNCDDQPFGDHLPNSTTYSSFYMPPCGGRLEFDRRNLEKVSPGAISADLPALLAVEAASCA